jgi:hypothetical protein
MGWPDPDRPTTATRASPLARPMYGGVVVCEVGAHVRSCSFAPTLVHIHIFFTLRLKLNMR